MCSYHIKRFSKSCRASKWWRKTTKLAVFVESRIDSKSMLQDFWGFQSSVFMPYNELFYWNSNVTIEERDTAVYVESLCKEEADGMVTLKILYKRIKQNPQMTKFGLLDHILLFNSAGMKPVEILFALKRWSVSNGALKQ